MGRAARNHGGTGGHGYLPLPGERPNYNQHIMNDITLFSLVKNNERKAEKSDKLKTVKKIPSYGNEKSCSDKKIPSMQLIGSREQPLKPTGPGCNKDDSSNYASSYKEFKTSAVKKASVNQLVQSDQKQVPSIQVGVKQKKPSAKLVSKTSMKQPLPIVQNQVQSQQVCLELEQQKVSSMPCLLKLTKTSVHQPHSSIQLPVTSTSLQETSLNHLVTSVQLPAVSIQQPATSVELPVTSVQLTEATIQFLETSVQMPVNSVQMPIKSAQSPMCLYENGLSFLQPSIVKELQLNSLSKINKFMNQVVALKVLTNFVYLFLISRFKQKHHCLQRDPTLLSYLLLGSGFLSIAPGGCFQGFCLLFQVKIH